MVVFLYGEDTFRIHQKIKALKDKFITASLGDTNLATLDGKTATYNDTVRQILAMPFLSKKRLVIIENLIMSKNKGLQENFPDLLLKIPESTVLAIVEEGMPDKRTALYKKLSKEKMAQDFPLLDETGLRRFIKNEVEDLGGEIEPDAVNKLVEYVGSNLWRMKNELEKLTAYSKQLTAQNVDLLVKPTVNNNVFKLVDAIGSRNLPLVLEEAEKLQEGGENEIYILSMIVYQYRNLLVVKDLQDRGIRSSWDIAKRASMHPFVAQKTSASAARFEFDTLKKSYATLLDFDMRIKTGKIEPKVALTLLLTKLASI